jgi:serine/threonine protein kinase
VLGEGSTTHVPPAAFGRFRVLHQIAVGSLGPVFRGEDPDTHQPVAIVHLQHDLGRQAALLAVGALRDLVGALPDHPSVAQPIDAGLHDQRPYLVTSFAQGEPLDVALSTYGPAAITDALPRLEALAQALDAAAALKIWHGALEPSDIMVSSDETVLTGMGLAQLLNHAGAADGGPYQAPEVQGGPRFSAAADQFAFAAIAYEWLFGQSIGRLPGVRVDVPNLPDVDRDALAGAFNRALSPDPKERFSTCAAFVETLRRSTVVERRGRGRAGDNVAALRPKRAAPRPSEDHLPFASAEDDVEDLTARAPAIPDPPARVSFADLDLDASARAAGDGVPASVATPLESRGAFSLGTVAAALAGGVALGAIGGYLRRHARNRRDVSSPRHRSRHSRPASRPRIARSRTTRRRQRRLRPALPRAAHPTRSQRRARTMPACSYAARPPAPPSWSTAPRAARRRSRSAICRSGRGSSRLAARATRRWSAG